MSRTIFVCLNFTPDMALVQTVENKESSRQRGQIIYPYYKTVRSYSFVVRISKAGSKWYILENGHSKRKKFSCQKTAKDIGDGKFSPANAIHASNFLEWLSCPGQSQRGF